MWTLKAGLLSRGGWAAHHHCWPHPARRLDAGVAGGQVGQRSPGGHRAPWRSDRRGHPQTSGWSASAASCCLLKKLWCPFFSVHASIDLKQHRSGLGWLADPVSCHGWWKPWEVRGGQAAGWHRLYCWPWQGWVLNFEWARGNQHPRLNFCHKLH